MAEPEADPERDQRTVFAYQVIEMLLNCIVLLLVSLYLHFADM